jgi:hypothetical protein
MGKLLHMGVKGSLRGPSEPRYNPRLPLRQDPGQYIETFMDDSAAILQPFSGRFSDLLGQIYAGLGDDSCKVRLGRKQTFQLRLAQGLIGQ